MGGPHLELFSRLHKFPQYNYVEKSQWSVYTFNIGKVKKLQYPLDNNFLSIFVLSPCQHQVFLSLEKREEERREGEGRGRFLFREACWRRHDSPSSSPPFAPQCVIFNQVNPPGEKGRIPSSLPPHFKPNWRAKKPRLLTKKEREEEERRVFSLLQLWVSERGVGFWVWANEWAAQCLRRHWLIFRLGRRHLGLAWHHIPSGKQLW